MSAAYDIGKDAIRIATTAGLSKDVIDLLQVKLTLLTDEVESLTKQLGLSRKRCEELGAENANLQRETVELKQQLQNSKPIPSGLHPDAEKILRLAFEADQAYAAHYFAAHAREAPPSAG